MSWFYLMSIIDLRKIGAITSEDEAYLARLIACTCMTDDMKYQISLCARHDFGWCNGAMMDYVLANLISLHSSRIDNFISSSEWLCGIFIAGNCLSSEHLRIMMMFVNINCSYQGQYYSGKNCWNDAPATMKIILDILDDAVIHSKLVFIARPITLPLYPTDTIEKLEKLPYELLRERVMIKWEY